MSDKRENQPLLQLADVTRRFGGLTAVDAVCLSVEPGETVSIIGPNGAGKTTLFNLISGLDVPDGGSVGSPAGRSVASAGPSRPARHRPHLPARPRLRQPDRAR